jgi:alpha-amylase
MRFPFPRFWRRRRRPKKQLPISKQFRVEILEDRVLLDVSAPPILQYDESRFGTIEKRVPDIFNAGYGTIFTPPPGRADSGNQSVGYDVYNRFDLGSPGNPTLYGTEEGLKTLVAALHQAGTSYYSDLVWNHDGFSDLNTPGFAASGGYPGFALSLSSNTNYAGYSDSTGDFHAYNDGSTTGMRLSGLLDIAQEKNYQFYRSPVTANPMDIPAGTTPSNGRLANVPDPSNAQFYPDQSQPARVETDPQLNNTTFTIYNFNNASPMNGTPVLENATGYLMRYTQWLVQTIGVDGFRLDAAKNMPSWVMNYFDLATYNASYRKLLNGQTEPIFGFSEVFDGNESLLQQYYLKNINPSQPNTVGGNRDVLDFPLYFALDNNLTGNGLQNNWNNVINASVDAADDGFANNGSEGVSFVSSADSPAPYLDNVAYAFTLTRPGNAIVYYNAQEFGTNRSFPRQGRGDALGGLYGNAITTLVNIRDTHPDGNFIPRDTEQNVLVYERDKSMLVGLNNRLDSGYDSRTVHTNFAPGTYLIELTGNATNTATDPDGAISPLLQVDANGNVNMRVPRNVNDSGVETDKGYVIYAPATPQGSLTLTNINHVIPGQTPTTSTNGTAVLSSIDAITANSFQIQLNTNNVNLLGNPQFHDQDANGDNALFKIDGGVDVTGNGFVSTNPGDVSYGFQQFTTTHNPGYFSSDGNGLYVQTIDTSKLSSGMHYITVRAFRHRSDGGPPIFTDFTQAIYIDHGPTVSAIVSLVPTVPGVNQNQTLTVQSTDLLANNIHVMWDLPAGLTNAQILNMVSNANQATQIDRNLWTMNENGLTNGNHVATVISYQIDGNANIQRFPGLFTSTIFGAGLGDLNFDGQYTAVDITQFGQVLNSNNSQYNPAADLNGDGVIDNSDLLLLYPRLQTVGASTTTLAAYNNSLLGPPSAGFATDSGDGIALNVNYPPSTAPALSFSWDLNHDGVFGDATGATLNFTWSQLNAFGINGPGTYPISVRVTDGPYTDQFNTSITVNPPVGIITSSLPDWTLNQGGYNQSIHTTGGSGSLNFNVTGTLPPGLILNVGGALVGQPTATGKYAFTITATDSLGSSDSHTYTVTINPAIAVSTKSLPAWTAGLPGYSQSIAASGGTGSLTFAASGTLPTGLTLATSGVLAGTPSVAGSYTFNVTATDSVGASAGQTYTVVINPPVTITGTLPNWTVNQGGYSQSINATGGTGSLTYAATGTLPTGLTLSGTGVLAGTPTAVGSFSFTVTATDSLGANGSNSYTIVISPPVAVAAASLATWTVGLGGYSQTITASGGTGSLTFGVPAGTLPPGLTLGTSGVLSGTPTQAGTFTFTVTATDATGASGSQGFSVTINLAIAITTTTLPNWTVDIGGYNQTLSASGGTGSLTFGTTTGTVPTGLTLSSIGVLSGTPTAADTFMFTVTASDSLGAGTSHSYTVTINNPLSLNPGVLPPGLENTPYNKTIATLGGTGTTTLTVSNLAGAIPGLSVPTSATGSLPISGTPTGTGTETFTVTATDSVGATTSTDYSITINPATVYLSLPSTGFAGSPGGAITVFPISINELQDQASVNHVGLMSATIALNFPTGVFNFPLGGNSATVDVSLGPVPLSDTVSPGGAADWTLTASAPADGLLNITLTAKSGKQITSDNPAGGGSLVLVKFPLASTYNPAAPTTQAITVVAANNNVHTTIVGSNGTYILQPTPPYSGSVTINPAPTITTTSLPDWTAGRAGYSQTISASRGTGSLTFSATGTLPAGLSLSGSGVLAGTPTTPGSYTFTITAKDGSGASASQSYTVTINPGVAITTTTLVAGATGTAYSDTVAASGGTGTLTFSATGALPTGLTLGGDGVLSGTPIAAGTYTFTVSATDSVGANASQSFTVTISGTAFSQYLVTIVGSSTVQAGHGFLVAVQAADSSGNPVTSYSGPATVSASISPNSAASNFPTTVAIDSSGLGLFLADLQQVGTFTISVASGLYSGSSSPVTVTPGPAIKLGFASQPVGTPTGVTLPAVTVKVLDAFGNTITTDNSDTVTLGIGSGPGLFTPASTTTATVHNGVATFTNLMLARPGVYALSARVPGELTGPYSAPLTVAPLQVVPSSFAGTPSGFSLQFNAPYLVNSTTPVLYGQGFGSTGLVPSVTLTQTRDGNGNSVDNAIAGSLVLNTATDSFTFVATNTTLQANNGSPILPDGVYTAVVHGSAATDGFQALNAGGGFLDGLESGTPGSGNFVTTFTVGAAAAGDDVLWVPATTDGPGQPLNAPGGNLADLGYPIYLNDSTGNVTDVRVTLDYDPALLTVTGVSGASFTLLASSTPGQAVLEYSGSALPAGKALPIGYVLATVPGGTTANPTLYKAKDLLHLSNVTLNSGSIPVTTGDAVHLVAYVGDGDGNGAYSSSDAVLVTRAVLQTDTGFTAYPLVDPTIVADTDGSGFIPADAALQINEAGVGFPTANLPRPPIPSGVVFQAIPNNVDPVLSVDRGSWTVDRSTVTVAIDIDDAHPAGSTGLIEAHLALTYDPTALTVSAADIHPGSLLTAAGGWTLTPVINPVTGQIAITLSSSTPVSTSLGGSLVTIDFQSTGSSWGLPAIDLDASVNPTGQQVITTELEDAQGTFTVSW